MIQKHDCAIIFLYLFLVWLLGKVKNNQVENRTFLLVLRYSCVANLSEGNLRTFFVEVRVWLTVLISGQ